MTYLRVERFWEYQNADAWKKALAAKKSVRHHPTWCKLTVYRDREMDALDYPTRLLFMELLRLAVLHTNVIPNDSEWIAKQISMLPGDVAKGVEELRKGRWIKVTRSARLSREFLESFATKKKKLEEENPLPPLGKTGKAGAVDVNLAVTAFLHSLAWDESFDQQAIREEFHRIARKPRHEGQLDELGAVRLWQELRAKRYEEAV